MANLANKVAYIGSKWPFLHIFLSFPPKWCWDWLRMVNFTWFTTFPIFCHQSISFLEKSQKFSFLGGGVHLANFFRFPTFSNCFTPMRLEMTHNGKFGQKCGLDWVKMAIFAYFSIFSPKMRLRLLARVNFTWFTTFPIFCHQSISFWRNLKNFHFWEGGFIGKFFEFSNFFKLFHTNAAGNDPQWQIWPKMWLRLGQNGHFCIFFYLFPQMRLRLLAMVNFTWFTTFPIFYHQSISFLEKSQKFSFLGGGYIGKFFEFSNFFKSFHTNAAGNDPQWQIWPIKWLRLGQNGQFCIFFYLFPQMRLKLTQNGQFHLIHNFPHLLPPKHLIFGEISKIFISDGGGYISYFLEFSNFFKLFHTNAAGNDPQWQIWPKKWLRLGQNGHFCIFFYLFPQNDAEIDSEWSISPDSQLFLSFATKASHFWRNLKNFHFWERGYIGNFLEFSNFFKLFHTNAAGNDPQWQIWPKKWLRLGQNGQFCIFFYLFPQNEAEITQNGQFHLIHNFSHLLPPKHLIFGEISKIFVSARGGTSANFLSFPTFSNCFTPMQLEMTHNGKFGQKSGLDWVKMAIFAYFSIFSPKMRLRLTRNGQFHLIHNFSHLLPPKHLIFGEISKIFISRRGYIWQFFGVFQLFQIVSHQCAWKWPTMAHLAKKVA